MAALRRVHLGLRGPAAALLLLQAVSLGAFGAARARRARLLLLRLVLERVSWASFFVEGHQREHVLEVEAGRAAIANRLEVPRDLGLGREVAQVADEVVEGRGARPV